MDVAVNQVVLEVKRIYYEAAIADEEAKALSEAATDARSLQDVMDRRVEVGEASEGDRLRTRVEALRAELEARRARAEAEAGKSRSRTGSFWVRSGPVSRLSTHLDPTRLPELAAGFRDGGRRAIVRSTVRPSLALKRRIGRMSAESAARMPGLTLSPFWQKELDRRTTGVALGLSIPLWNRNQGQVRIAQGEQAEAEAELLAVRTEIEIELERRSRTDRSAQRARDLLPPGDSAGSVAGTLDREIQPRARGRRTCSPGSKRAEATSKFSARLTGRSSRPSCREPRSNGSSEVSMLPQ